jgi:hypothetical protein
MNRQPEPEVNTTEQIATSVAACRLFQTSSVALNFMLFLSEIPSEQRLIYDR